MQNVRLQGIVVGSRDTFEAMNLAVEEAPAAFAHLASEEHFGKVRLREKAD